MPTNRSYSGHTKGNIMAADLRQLLLKLYLINNFKLEHKVYIYTYRGVTDVATNPLPIRERRCGRKREEKPDPAKPGQRRNVAGLHRAHAR